MADSLQEALEIANKRYEKARDALDGDLAQRYQREAQVLQDYVDADPEADVVREQDSESVERVAPEDGYDSGTGREVSPSTAQFDGLGDEPEGETAADFSPPDEDVSSHTDAVDAGNSSDDQDPVSPSADPTKFLDPEKADSDVREAEDKVDGHE